MLSTVAFSQTYIYKCGDPENAMLPEIDVQVRYDKKTDFYTYIYKIKNKSDALVPIARFRLFTFTDVAEIKSSENWKFLRFSSNYLHWSAKSEGLYANITVDKAGNPSGPPGNTYDIAPGKSIDGFEFKSKYPPGPTKIEFNGSPLNGSRIVDSTGKDVPDFRNVIPENELAVLFNEGDKACPGYFDANLDVDKPPRDHGLVSVTIGPIPPERVPAKIRIRKINEKKWRGSPESEPDIEVLPIDTGRIQVMLFGSQELDVKKIDLASLSFGQGKAKPVKTVILTDFTDKNGEIDNDIKEHIKKNNVQHLLMEFNLDDVDIRCDSERALFLDGKYGTKDLFGAVRIKHGSCMKKKNNAKELKKIKDYEVKIKNEAEEDRKKKNK